MRGRGRAHRAKDPRRVLVGPVVEDPREDVGIALRHRVEEASGREVDPVAELGLVPHRLGEIEDDPAKLGTELDQLAEQRAVAAADVDDNFAVAPFESR